MMVSFSLSEAQWPQSVHLFETHLKVLLATGQLPLLLLLRNMDVAIFLLQSQLCARKNVDGGRFFKIQLKILSFYSICE